MDTHSIVSDYHERKGDYVKVQYVKAEIKQV